MAKDGPNHHRDTTMITETTTRTVYTFDELSDEAKETAREDWRRTVAENFYVEYVIDDAVTIAGLMGIDIATRNTPLMNGTTRSEPVIYWSGFWSQGDGASFEGSYRYKRGSVKAVKEYAPQDTDLHYIAKALQDIQKPYFYRLTASISQSRYAGNYVHENTMNADVEYDGDEYRDIRDAEDGIQEAIRDFARWIYKQLEREWDYQYSDEAVDESILANEMEYTEDGEPV